MPSLKLGSLIIFSIELIKILSRLVNYPDLKDGAVPLSGQVLVLMPMGFRRAYEFQCDCGIF